MSAIGKAMGKVVARQKGQKARRARCGKETEKKVEKN